MFSYHRRFLFPIHIEHPDEKLAAVLANDFNGQDSEFASFAAYLFQSLHLPNSYLRDFLGMLAAEELGHWELIGVVIRKLGLNKLPQIGLPVDITSGQDNSKNTEKDIFQDIIPLLRKDEDSELKSKQRYLKLINSTNDTSLKKIFQFLAQRENIHQKLLNKIITLVSNEAGNEQFGEVIHEYRMSLRVKIVT